MARAVWTGSVAFGLVTIPVGLYAATESHTVQFHQFQRGTTARIRNRRVNEETGEEVGQGDIVKGVEDDHDGYVILDPEELERAEPGRSRTIEIGDFVDESEIDPIYYQHSYYLAPSTDNAERPYALLVAAMERGGRVGIAQFVMRSKEYLAAVRARAGVLVLETLFFADEVRDPEVELPRAPVEAATSDRDLQMALSLLESMTTTWDPSRYHDTYRQRVAELVEAKRGNQQPKDQRRPRQLGTVVDLHEALSASLRQRQTGGTSRRRTSKRQTTTVAAELDQMSKRELYALATEVDLPRRSTMNRDQLRDALADAGTRPARRAPAS